MNTENTTKTTKDTPPVFKRMSAVGINVLSIPEKGAFYFKITGNGEHEVKKGKNQGKYIPFLRGVNLMSGEDGIIWVDGGMKAKFNQIGGLGEKLHGRAFEFNWLGKREFETEDGEIANVNEYSIFEIDPGN